MAALLLPLPVIPPRSALPLLTLAALAAPASRTAWWTFLAGPSYSYTGGVCPLGARPHVFPDGDRLAGIIWEIVAAEANGRPLAVMALGLSAMLALRGRWGVIAGWVTAASSVVIAVVFTIPYAIRIVTEGCVQTLRFGGWDIVYGPFPHHLAGAVLVMFLALVLREEADRRVPPRGTPP